MHEFTEQDVRDLVYYLRAPHGRCDAQLEGLNTSDPAMWVREVAATIGNSAVMDAAECIGLGLVEKCRELLLGNEILGPGTTHV